MKYRVAYGLSVVGLLAVTGCLDSHFAGGPGDGIVPGATGSLLDDLQSSPQTLTLTPADGDTGSVISARVSGRLSEEGTDTTFEIEGGELRIAATPTGRLTLEGLSATVADIELTAEQFPPNGVRVTDMTIALSDTMPGTASWAPSEQSVSLEAVFDLEFDWAVDLGEGPVALATQRVRNIAFNLELERDAVTGVTHARLIAQREGEFWSWDGLLQLSDLVIDFQAAD